MVSSVSPHIRSISDNETLSLVAWIHLCFHVSFSLPCYFVSRVSVLVFSLLTFRLSSSVIIALKIIVMCERKIAFRVCVRRIFSKSSLCWHSSSIQQSFHIKCHTDFELLCPCTSWIICFPQFCVYNTYALKQIPVHKVATLWCKLFVSQLEFNFVISCPF